MRYCEESKGEKMINFATKLFWLRTDSQIEERKEKEKSTEPFWISEEHKRFLENMNKELKKDLGERK